MRHGDLARQEIRVNMKVVPKNQYSRVMNSILKHENDCSNATVHNWAQSTFLLKILDH